IIKGDPDWNLLPPNVPPAIRSLLRRCLEKDPNRRLHEIADARIEIEDAISQPAEIEQSSASPRSGRRPQLAGALCAIGLVLALSWIAFHNPTPDTRLMRLSIVAPQAQVFFALSPDGKRLAYIGTAADGKQQLYLRNLDALNPVPIAGTEGADFVFWSPDSRFIGFLANDNKLKTIEVSGGPAQVICDTPAIAPGATWSKDGVIVFSAFEGGLRQVSDAGGTPTSLTTVEPSRSELFHNFPYFLPDGRHFL